MVLLDNTMTQLAGGSLSESDQGTPGYRMGDQVLLLRQPSFAGICTWH